ncbi:hypothetical protein ACUNEU_27280 [Serratia sp. IR-2025]
MKIKAIVTSKETPFSLQDVNLREPDIDEVLVRIIASGVCHTDAVVLRGGMRLFRFLLFLAMKALALLSALAQQLQRLYRGIM